MGNLNPWYCIIFLWYFIMKTNMYDYICETPDVLTYIINNRKEIVQEFVNEYKDKIELQKEVLAALPRNNNKNNKLYKAKVEEMLKEYQVDKEVVEEEITKRRNRYLSLEYDKNIDNITNKINELLPQLPLLNKYNSSYEKSNLDIILYELGHFYKTDLDKVNTDIKKAIDIFSLVGIPLSIEDFNYSYYSGNYMKRFLSNEVNDDILSLQCIDFK